MSQAGSLPEDASRPGLDLAVVGNCTWGGLIDGQGRLVWACLPRFDSDPAFPALLGETVEEEGTFAIELDGLVSSEQAYERNTAILRTVLRDAHGGVLEIRDFAPRFSNLGRIYRPSMLIRRIRPLEGEPRIRIVLRPRTGYGASRPAMSRGSNHVRFLTQPETLRLTTDAPVSYVLEGTAFVIQRPIDLILGPDETFSGPLTSTAQDFEDRTRSYWQEWSRTLSVPFEWQEAVIRSAIALKLCSFEETGAIVAALTTSIPEAAGTERNWDYRFCWLRDAYFVVHALNRLGATKTMESYLGYLTDLVAGANGGLQPVYGIGLERELTERTETSLAGYRGMGPVRVGNQAYEHLQNDVYGSVVLAATQAFFDHRLLHPGGIALFELLEKVGESARACWDQPDAGLWEFRTRARVHTFSAVMCWAACDRLARIAEKVERPARAAFWSSEAERMHRTILERAWSEERQSMTEAFDGDTVDASLLLLPELGFLEAQDPRFLGTLAVIERDLRRGPYLFRYREADDFGVPSNAFNICTFWYIDALVAVGRSDEARELFEIMLGHRNPAGFLSEDLDPKTGELWGNFPQTYSMVGLIKAAMKLSRSWEESF
jgi:GH15 family glucan-1,4-alpha-glucosidase